MVIVTEGMAEALANIAKWMAEAQATTTSAMVSWIASATSNRRSNDLFAAVASNAGNVADHSLSVTVAATVTLPNATVMLT